MRWRCREGIEVVQVWDLPTRVGHWLLALLVIVAVFTSEQDGAFYIVHAASGIGAGMVVLFRLVWGVVGNERARFADFVYGWSRVRAYSLDLLRLRPPKFLGHNPLGGWMAVALLAIALFASMTGVVSGGLLGQATAEAAEEVHEALGSLIQVMIVVHIAGVLVDWLLTGDNLVAAMISGRKPVEPAVVDESVATGSPRDARGGPIWLALAVAVPLVLLGGWLHAQIDPAAPRPESEYRQRD
jgi:cytochrome b